MDLVLIIAILIAVFSLKEILKEVGCKTVNNKLNCYNNNLNNFAKSNKLEKDETIDSAVYKIKDIVRHYEKVGTWKYFYILSIISVFIILLIFKNNFNIKLNFNMCIIMVIVMCSVQYFFDSWMDFHIYKNITINADKLIDFIKK